MQNAVMPPPQEGQGQQGQQVPGPFFQPYERSLMGMFGNNVPFPYQDQFGQQKPQPSMQRLAQMQPTQQQQPPLMMGRQGGGGRGAPSVFDLPTPGG